MFFPLVLIIFIIAKVLYLFRCYHLSLYLLNFLIGFKYNLPILFQIKGDIFKDKKEYEQAINEYAIVLKKIYNDFFVMYDMGFCYYQLNQFYKALEIFDKLDGLYPNHHNILLNLGLCYFRLQKFKEAIPIYDKLLCGKFKKDAILHMQQGINYRMIGDDKKAVEEYEKARKHGIESKYQKGLIEAIERAKSDIDFQDLIEQIFH